MSKELQKCESEMIAAIGYDPEGEVLAVEFKKNGRIYNYHGVPEKLAQEFIAAPSKGGFFHTKIRHAYTGVPQLSQVEEVQR